MRIVQKGKHPVVLFLSERVELVVMALSTLNRDTQDALADGVHTIEHGFHPELLRVDASFLVDHRIAEKASGDDLILRRFRQQIAGQLFDDELIVRQVAVEGFDHPVAVKPDLAGLVLLVAVGIGVTSGIEPQPSPALSVVRRLQQPVDLFLVGISTLVLQKSVYLFNRGWQPNEVKAQTGAAT